MGSTRPWYQFTSHHIISQHIAISRGVLLVTLLPYSTDLRGRGLGLSISAYQKAGLPAGTRVKIKVRLARSSNPIRLYQTTTTTLSRPTTLKPASQQSEDSIAGCGPAQILTLVPFALRSRRPRKVLACADIKVADFKQRESHKADLKNKVLLLPGHPSIPEIAKRLAYPSSPSCIETGVRELLGRVATFSLEAA
ncbi:hypothetical protein WAI453_005180 [Rhynchosporium graminicola]